MTPIRSTTQRTGIEGAVMGGETLQSLALSLSEAREEIERLRAALAQSDLPCAYCSLPKDEWAKCASGFPGCDRADDAMGCPELGARLSIESATRQRDEALEALRPFAKHADTIEREYGKDIPDQQWQFPTVMMSDLRRVRSVLENSKTGLADAPKNPGTEQREAGV